MFWEKLLLQLAWGIVLALEGSIDYREFHHLMEDSSEMAHLVFHHVGIRVVSVKAEDFELAFMFEFQAFLAGTFRQIIAAKHLIYD